MFPLPLLHHSRPVFSICTHLFSEYGSNSSSDSPPFLPSSNSSSEMTLDTHKHKIWKISISNNCQTTSKYELWDQPVRKITASSSVLQLTRSRRQGLLVTCVIWRREEEKMLIESNDEVLTWVSVCAEEEKVFSIFQLECLCTSVSSLQKWIHIFNILPSWKHSFSFLQNELIFRHADVSQSYIFIWWK